jgi:hypothetical protein
MASYHKRLENAGAKNVKTGCIPAVTQVPEEDEITEFFETYDVNNDGSVTFDEILDADSHLREEGEEGEEGMGEGEDVPTPA